MKRYNKYLKLVAGIVLVAFLLPQIAFAKPAPGQDGNDEEYGVIGDIFIDGLKVDVDNSVFKFLYKQLQRHIDIFFLHFFIRTNRMLQLLLLTV